LRKPRNLPKRKQLSPLEGGESFLHKGSSSEGPRVATKKMEGCMGGGSYKEGKKNPFTLCWRKQRTARAAERFVPLLIRSRKRCSRNQGGNKQEGEDSGGFGGTFFTSGSISRGRGHNLMKVKGAIPAKPQIKGHVVESCPGGEHHSDDTCRPQSGSMRIAFMRN